MLPPFDLLLDVLRRISVPPTEEESERDGLLSHDGEFHALLVGFLVGFGAVFPSKKLRRFAFLTVGLDAGRARGKALEEAREESWYAAAGVFLGAVFAIACMCAVALFVAAVAPALA